jgi:hypothetical protein
MYGQNAWNQPLRMLLAGVNPSVAYKGESREATAQSGMLQRDIREDLTADAARSASTDGSDAPAQGSLPSKAPRNLMQRILDKLAESDWERSVREREAYLADAVDLYDLEYRMRKYDREIVRRGQSHYLGYGN